MRLTRKTLWIIVLSLLGLLVLYGLSKNYDSVLPSIITFLKSKNFMYLVLLVVVGLVIRHYYLKRNNGEELDELKKIVHSKDADDLIKLQFPIESNMAYSTYYDQNEMRVMLRRPRDLQLKDKKRWTDATTGVPFYAIEIHSTKGLYAGISTLVLRMDSGLDYLKKNMF